MKLAKATRGANSALEAVFEAAGAIILGKEHQLQLAIACLLAKGHLLIEDVPGVGKTTLALLLGRLLGLQYSRIQYTSDLLPADVVGVSIYDRRSETFRFHRGPIFAQLLLADEINRATPKTQSALLEAMEEQQVTVEGETRPLPEPFFVVATQNPLHQIGTFPLPESQLDRFMMRIHLGYPEAKQEKELLAGEDRRRILERRQPILSTDDLLRLQQRVEDVTTAPPIIEYCHEILLFTRRAEQFTRGLSPRAGLSLLKGAKAWAVLNNRDYVIPEDIQAVLGPCVTHRLTGSELTETTDQNELSNLILESVPVP